MFLSVRLTFKTYPATFHIAVVALRAQYENNINPDRKYESFLSGLILFSCSSCFSRKKAHTMCTLIISSITAKIGEFDGVLQLLTDCVQSFSKSRNFSRCFFLVNCTFACSFHNDCFSC